MLDIEKNNGMSAKSDFSESLKKEKKIVTVDRPPC